MEMWKNKAQYYIIATGSEEEKNVEQPPQPQPDPGSTKLATYGSDAYFEMLDEKVEMEANNIPAFWEGGLSVNKAKE